MSHSLRRGRVLSAAVLAVSVLVSACSTLDSINPFSDSAGKGKLAELEPLRQSAEMRRLWQAGVASSGSNSFTPAIYGRTVFAADGDGYLARFDEGSLAWRVKTEAALSGGVGSNGKVVVVGSAKGQVLAFDDKGKALWTARVSSEVLAAPVVTGDLVIIRSGDNRITALAAADGKQRWIYQRPTPALSLRSAVGVTVFTDKAVLAGFPGGKLVAISMINGAPLWEATVAIPKGATELERVADVTSNPVIEGRQVCAAAYQGRVACFDLMSGEAQWTRDVSSTAGLDMDARYVYVTDDNGGVQAFDRRTGASIWKQDKLRQRGVGRPLVVGDYVAVADAKGLVHLLRQQDGAFAGRTETDGSPVVAPPVAAERGFVIQTSKGSVAFFQP